jgi:ubiquinone/menaquinone biosynthesis C-methylase UbiE
VTDEPTDRRYLTEQQYATDANLAARQSLYVYQQPRVKVWARALDLAELAGDETVLDVGCGNGLYLGALAQRQHQGFVCGLDLSAGMLTAARVRSSEPLLVGDAQRLPFAERSFDRVLAMHMLYHVPDRALAIAELRRVLRRGGATLAVTNSHGHLAELLDLINESRRALLGKETSDVSRTYLRFSCESGSDELAAAFQSVERHDMESGLVVTDVPPIVDYVRSMGHVVAVPDDLRPDLLAEIERRAAQIIRQEGALRIATRVCCFVCR